MRTNIIVALALLVSASSCMSSYYGKLQVRKHPELGVATTCNVGSYVVLYSVAYELDPQYIERERIEYAGIVNNVISLVHREWRYNARYDEPPTTVQTYQYTLSLTEPFTDITLGRYQIRVSEATNNSITYILVSGMPDYYKNDAE